MFNKKAYFILFASLIILSLFGCGGGGAANIDASSSSNSAQTGDGAATTGDGAATTGDGAITTGQGAITLAWDAPTTNTDGSYLNPATDLSLYKIHYGTAPLTYTTSVNVTNPGTTTISKTFNLPPGTYYFAVTAVDSSGQESSYSNEVVKTL